MGCVTKRVLVLVLTFVLVSMVACQNRAGPGGSTASALPPTPEAGKATVVGRVFSRQTSQPITNTPVRLAEVHRMSEDGDGAFILDDAFSPGAITDHQGNFVIANVEAREYVIVIGDVNVQYDVIAEPSGKAQIWNAVADQVLDVGELRVNFH